MSSGQCHSLSHTKTGAYARPTKVPWPRSWRPILAFFPNTSNCSHYRWNGYGTGYQVWWSDHVWRHGIKIRPDSRIVIESTDTDVLVLSVAHFMTSTVKKRGLELASKIDFTTFQCMMHPENSGRHYVEHFQPFMR